MMSDVCRSLALLIVLVCTMGARPALAGAPLEDRETARRAFVEGTRQYDLGEYRRALEAFKRAYLAYESPAFLYNIARCHELLGERAVAIERYRTFLALSPNPSERAPVEQRITTLQAELAAEQARERARPAATATVAPALDQPAVHAQATKTPVYKKWWLWTTVGAVAVGIGLGVGLGLGLRPAGAPGSHFGTVGAF